MFKYITFKNSSKVVNCCHYIIHSSFSKVFVKIYNILVFSKNLIKVRCKRTAVVASVLNLFALVLLRFRTVNQPASGAFINAATC